MNKLNAAFRKPLDSKISIIVSDIKTEIQKETTVDRRRLYVLPSQLNAAEYPSNHTQHIVTHVDEYKKDNTGGPHGQLAGDPGVAQFIIDNASNENRRNGIDNTRGMDLDTIEGVTLKNGYLQLGNTLNQSIVDEFTKRLPKMTLFGMKNVRVNGLDNNNENFVDMNHTVDLAYASAVPVGIYDNRDTQVNRQIATRTIYAQYTAAMRMAYQNTPETQICDLILMPLGGGVFKNSLQNIQQAIVAAYNTVKLDQSNFDTRVHICILAFSQNETEIQFFRKSRPLVARLVTNTEPVATKAHDGTNLPTLYFMALTQKEQNAYNTATNKDLVANKDEPYRFDGVLIRKQGKRQGYDWYEIQRNNVWYIVKPNPAVDF